MGLGLEGRVQADAVGVELSSVLYSYDATKARVCHAPNSPSGAGTAKALVAQLEDESLGSQKLVAVQESLADLSGDPASLKKFISEACWFWYRKIPRCFKPWPQSWASRNSRFPSNTPPECSWPIPRRVRIVTRGP